MNAVDIFKAKSHEGMALLIRRFHLSDFQAGGILGNLGHESGGLTILREIGQPPGYGGYGFGQWTGPRRKLFLNWCAMHGLDWRSEIANWGYLAHELSGEDPRNSYAYVVVHMRETENLADATRAFMNYYERPGVPAFSDRLRWAQIALDAYRAAVPKEETINVQL